MGQNTKKGFSAAELLITLSTIGLLCSTSFAVNNFENSNCKVAEIKTTQTNEALSAWNNNFLKNNENSIGIAYSFTTEEALINSLKNYLNIKEVKESAEGETFLEIDGYRFKDYKKVTLNNGTFLNIKYIYSNTPVTFGDQIYTSNKFSSYYAYITVNVPYKNKTKITNVYLLKYNGLKDIGYIDPICES